MKKNIFKKDSLEKLTSPEQIDRLLVIVGVRGWISISVLVLLTICILIWSVVGEITVTAQGIGVFFNPENMNIVRSNVDGVVEQVNFTEGDHVEAGEELMTLSNPILLSKYEDLKEDIKRREKSLATEQKNYNELVEVRLRLHQTMLELKKLKLSSLEESFKTGVQDPFLRLKLQQDIYDAKISVEIEESELALLKEQKDNEDYPSIIEGQEWELLSLKATLQNLKEAKQKLKIYAPISGTVVLVHSIIGEEVGSGSILLWVEAELDKGAENHIYGFFPVDQGERIQDGMQVQLQFASVDSEKYGKMVGTVKKKFPYAATQESAVLKSIPSQKLRDFLALEFTTLVIQINPKYRADNPLKYQWTTKEGPPFEIHPGATATLTVVIERKKPISYVIPAFFKSQENKEK